MVYFIKKSNYYQMLILKTKNGYKCEVPETDAEDLVPKFNINSDIQKAKIFYEDNGFVVLKKVFEEKDCKYLINAWENEVKGFKGYIYRQASAKLERNIFNDQKWVMNPILNLQSLNCKIFPLLRSGFENIISSHKILANFVSTIINDKPMIVQSMYFEGNSVTWEHQDSYYLDDEIVGNMIAGWIALENIKANAGRFFVCAKSHLDDISEMSMENNIADNHDAFIEKINKQIKEKKYKIYAPKLDCGDVLLWNSLTIHGSLDSQSKTNSRSSITFHAIRSSSKFFVLRNSFRNLSADISSPFDIFRPKDQNKKINRLIFYFESRFPKFFYKIKNTSIKLLLNLKLEK